uniref:Uncharacterized protein n=1 Tax=viral metagenome TaxID=1070528 RepID=A0A6C0DA25_9ZZZZ
MNKQQTASNNAELVKSSLRRDHTDLFDTIGRLTELSCEVRPGRRVSREIMHRLDDVNNAIAKAIGDISQTGKSVKPLLALIGEDFKILDYLSRYSPLITLDDLIFTCDSPIDPIQPNNAIGVSTGPTGSSGSSGLIGGRRKILRKSRKSRKVKKSRKSRK